MRTKILNIFFLLFSVGIFISCSSSSILDNPELYQKQISDWRNRAIKNPKDSVAIKNLSIYYVQSKQHERAAIYIDKALELLPDDPALLFYKGLNSEFFNKQYEAVKFYMRYANLPQDSPYRDLMEGRYFWLMRQQTYDDIKTLIKNEEALSFQSISDSALAVFPLIYQGINQKYIPLSRGFSEMISIDLAKVRQFTVLERVRIQAVLDELKFNQTPLMDQSTAPRTGKLLKAGVIVSGDYDITKDDNLKINLGSWDAETSERKSWVNKSGGLKDLFILQKEIVFDFLQKNNIELTQTEKEAIAYISTRNLESFLAYSNGLLKEDAGDFNGAANFFQRAVELDPKFNAAGEKFQSSLSTDRSSGSKEQLISTLRTEDPIVKNESIQLVEDRTKTLENKISSNFMQGIDSRSPAQEVGVVDTELPLPPPPPQSGR